MYLVNLADGFADVIHSHTKEVASWQIWADESARIAKQMTLEMLQCPSDEFLEHYGPLYPSSSAVDAAFDSLKAKGLLKEARRLSNDGKTLEKILVWKGFEDTHLAASPSEDIAFSALEDIVDTLGNIEWDHNQIGSNFKVDACITSNPRPTTTGESKYIISEEVAEFKKSAKGVDNVVWMYGITIQDTTMSVCYFSRSHSIRSEVFKFRKDIKTFIRVFISFLYATRPEMGYDPTIHRVKYGKMSELCYVYELGTPEAPRYYRTIEPLFNPRVFCITGRNTRVWRAIEVEGYDGDFIGKVKDGGREVAVKDVWLDEGSLTEGQKQAEIFEGFKKISEERCGWAPLPLRSVLKDALKDEGYKKYFMEIECDRQLAKAKATSKSAMVAPDLLHFIPKEPGTDDDEKGYYDPNIVANSTQTTGLSGLPANLFTDGNNVNLKAKASSPSSRSYKVKQQYRLVYKEVGHSLASAESLETSFNAILDAFVALVLLYLAGWVHRDVSAGNIMVVKRSNGRFGSKLNDLEYAKHFEDNSASSDPKTGTPYFMPVEIHSGTRLCYHKVVNLSSNDYEPDPFSDETVPAVTRNQVLTSLPPRFQFQHDLESLWWITLWILIYRVVHVQGRKLACQIFTYSAFPSPSRWQFFVDTGLNFSCLEDHIHPELQSKGIVDLVCDIRHQLWNSYLREGPLDLSALDSTYAAVWRTLAKLVINIQAIKDITLDNTSLLIKTRKRPAPEPTTKAPDDANYEAEEVDGTSDDTRDNKRQKMDAHTGGTAPRRRIN